jgi:hypothetical protein
MFFQSEMGARRARLRQEQRSLSIRPERLVFVIYRQFEISWHHIMPGAGRDEKVPLVKRSEGLYERE